MARTETNSARINASEMGQYLRLLRVKHGLTMVQAAEQGGLTQGYLSQIENGLYVPSGRILAKLARVYQIPEIQLLSRAGLVDPGMLERIDSQQRPAAESEGLSLANELSGSITAEQVEAMLRRNMRLLEMISGQLSKGAQASGLPAAEPGNAFAETESPSEFSLPLYDSDWRPVLNSNGEPAAFHIPATLCQFDLEAFILCVNNAAMEPRIRSGDWVVISPVSDPEPGHIAAVNVNNQIHLRQAVSMGEHLAFLPLNHEYATNTLIEGAMTEGVDVLGRVLRIVNREL